MRQWYIAIKLRTGSDADGATVARQVGELLDGSKYDVVEVAINEEEESTSDE